MKLVRLHQRKVEYLRKRLEESAPETAGDSVRGGLETEVRYEERVLHELTRRRRDRR